MTANVLSVKVDWGYAMSRTASVDPEVARVHAVGFLLKDTPGNWPPPYDRRGGPGHAVPIVIKRLITSFVGKTPPARSPRATSSRHRPPGRKTWSGHWPVACRTRRSGGNSS
ncbi:hypothetical protein ACFQX6_12225 [Streptosporangium lutulentum]